MPVKSNLIRPFPAGGESRKASGQKRWHLQQEVLGICLFTITAFLFLILLSHHPSDPSFTHAISQPRGVMNFGGIVGAYLSDALLEGFGMIAFLVPVITLFISMALFSVSLSIFQPLRIMGIILLGSSSAALLSMGFEELFYLGDTIRSGGLAGHFLSNFLEQYLNVGGSAVFLGLAFVLSLIWVMRLSFFGVARSILGIFFWSIGLISRYFQKRKERRSLLKQSGKRKKNPIGQKQPPTIVDTSTEQDKKENKPTQASFAFLDAPLNYRFPSLSLLEAPDKTITRHHRESLLMNARLLEKKLGDFGVSGRVTEVRPGPVITMYELEPAPGVKINKIVNLHDDLALALRAVSVRIVAPVPGKAVVGIEIPNAERETVYLKEVLASKAFQESTNKLAITLGKDILGNPIVVNLATMPHLLIAGATGAGKSVCLNAIICSILFKASPQDVRLLMVDPKRLELTTYDNIPHLLHPVVTNPKKAATALTWATQEMERRYQILAEEGVRSIDRYNAKIDARKKLKGKVSASIKEPSHDSEANEEEMPKRLPYIVIIIDELSDLMMVSSHQVEESITRLAQMARAAGIHLVVATQRPSVDVLTGIIKANLPVRISFQVSSKTDSRTILDTNGAESLLGAGDMLFMPPGTSKLQRIHGAYVSEVDVARVVEFLKKGARPDYDETILTIKEDEKESEDQDQDDRYDDAIALVTSLKQASISLVQRHLRVGYNRAARIIEKMEKEGIVGPSDGSKPREVIIGKSF